MSKYTEFFLSSNSNVVELETLEIQHSSFTKVYRVVRNATAGLTAMLETNETVEFEYSPLRISGIGLRDNLDFGISVDLGDLGEILPTELDRVSSDDNFAEKPVVLYRTYSSDDLTVPLYGPLVLEISGFSFDRTGSSFEAKAPSLNSTATGELYKLDRFPMLRGFL